MVIFNSYHPLMVIFGMLHGHRAQVILHGIEDLEPQSREVRPSLARSRWSLAGDDWVVLVEKTRGNWVQKFQLLYWLLPKKVSDGTILQTCSDVPRSTNVQERRSLAQS
jgi:hypothetical protein